VEMYVGVFPTEGSVEVKDEKKSAWCKAQKNSDRRSRRQQRVAKWN